MLATRDIYILKSICDNYVILKQGNSITKGQDFDIFTELNNKKLNIFYKQLPALICQVKLKEDLMFNNKKPMSLLLK